MRFTLLVALTLALQTSAALAGLIILPESLPKRCWVWFAPPATVQKSAADFLSRVALGLLPKSGLAEPGRATLDLLNDLNAGKLRVEIKDGQEPPFVLADHKLSLSVAAAEKIVGARTTDKAQLLETTSSVDPALASAWLDLLGTGKSNLWDETEIRLRWHHAVTGADPKTFAVTPIELARKLWPQVVEARDKQNPLAVAQSFGAEPLAVFESAPQAMENVGLTPDLIKAFIQQNDFRTAFLELGLRAAKLVTAQRMHESATLKPVEAEQILNKLQTDYNEIYSLIATQLQTGLIIMSDKMPK